MRDIIFFSKHKKDIYSPQLLKMLKMLPFHKDFLFYNIDKDPQTGKVNEDVIQMFEIETVPTIYFKGQKLEGVRAFDFLKSIFEQLNQQGQQGQRFQQVPQMPNRGYQQPQTQTQNPQKVSTSRSEGGIKSFTDSQFNSQFDSQFASPFESTTITGENFTEDDIRNPRETKSNSRSFGVEDVLDDYQKQYNQEHNPIGLSNEAVGFAGQAMRNPY